MSGPDNPDHDAQTKTITDLRDDNIKLRKRVRELEGALTRLASAADEITENAEHDINNAGNGWFGCAYSYLHDVENALLATRATLRKDTP